MILLIAYQKVWQVWNKTANGGLLITQVKWLSLFNMIMLGIFQRAWQQSNKMANLGFVDKTGKVVIPVQYDNAWVLINGKAKVSLNGETFYIDKTGKRLD